MQRRNPRQREQAPPRRRLAALNGNGRPTQRRVPHPRKPSGKRKVRLFGLRLPPWVLILVGALILLALDGAYAAITLRSSLEDARDRFEAASEALDRSDFRAAKGELSSALDAATTARTASRHPGLLATLVLPGIRDDTHSLQALSDAATLAARAGLAGSQAAEAMGAGGKEGLVSTVYRAGRVRFDTIERGEPHIARADRLLAEASQRLEESPRPHFGPVREAFFLAKHEVQRAELSTHKAQVVFEALPDLLAKDDTRRYLLAFQALGEARGTGGVIGLFGVVEAEDGEVQLTTVSRPYALPLQPVSSSQSPPWFQRRYEPLFSFRQWPQANMSPYFPEVAPILLRMYEAATGEQLDGVVAMDPVSFGQLLSATGPLQTPEFGEINSSNAAEILMHDSYTEFPSTAQQNRFLKGLITRFWQRFHDGQLDAIALAEALNKAVRSQHFKMHTNDPAGQRALSELGATGNFTTAGPNLQFVFHNQLAVGKVDFFLRREIDTHITLEEGGTAKVTTTVTATNDAPSGPASFLLGREEFGDPSGLSRMHLNFVLPKEAEVGRFSIEGVDRRPFKARESGYPVAWEIVDVPPGETVKLALSYSVPDAVDLSAGEDQFAMALVPQALPRPDRFSVEITAPEGFELKLDEEDTALTRTDRVAGVLDHPRLLRVWLSRQ